MKDFNLLMQMPIDEFIVELILEGEFKTEKDARLYILECLNGSHNDPTMEFPIEYVETSDVKVQKELIPSEGPQLTDEFIKESGNNIDVMEGQISLFEDKTTVKE